ncbi:MAG: hypothetical protein WCP97_00480 [bacterium]
MKKLLATLFFAFLVASYSNARTGEVIDCYNVDDVGVCFVRA